MNITEALHTDLPFAHPDMIGAFKRFHYNGLVCIIHRDCIDDFNDKILIDYILDDVDARRAGIDNQWFLNCLDVNDLMRDDWYNTF